MVRRESRPSTIGHITLGTKQTGAPSAGNPHAGCDVAGPGNGFTVWLLRHSQRKRGAMARLNLRNTAPVLDPTTARGHPGVATKPRGGLRKREGQSPEQWRRTALRSEKTRPGNPSVGRKSDESTKSCRALRAKVLLREHLRFRASATNQN